MPNSTLKPNPGGNLNNNQYIEKLVEIGMALSLEKDINQLLEMVVDRAREMANADAGTLYIIDKNKEYLEFKIVQNRSIKVRMGGKSGIKITFPSVPLIIDNEQNLINVSSYVAITGKTVNIRDVYNTKEDFDFFGPEKYDNLSGYRTKSMLVIPLKNHKNDIIGVLQLINAQDLKTKKIIKFSEFSEYLVKSLASQAAVALNNAQLIQNLKDLLSAFIKSMAVAIDEKSPYTGGHIRRVVDLSMLIVDKINKSDNEHFRTISFSDDEIKELRMAAWMHDVGKIVTPENIINKANKLEAIIDRIDLIETRFQLIESLMEIDFHQKKSEFLAQDLNTDSALDKLKNEFKTRIKDLNQDFEFIKSCNNTSDFMLDDNIERIKSIGAKQYTINHQSYPYLNEDEIENLCIRKGTLTDEERTIIENHARITQKITGELPFPDQLARVSEFAAGHHERPDGTGYPDGLSGEGLAIQSRIIAIADIFEALTAKDRPYRKPMNLSQAIKILGFMKKDNHIDENIYDLFMEMGIYRNYAKKELDPEQIDMDL